MKVNLCYLGQMGTDMVGYKQRPVHRVLLCPLHTQPQPPCPIKYQGKIAALRVAGVCHTDCELMPSQAGD